MVLLCREGHLRGPGRISHPCFSRHVVGRGVVFSNGLVGLFSLRQSLGSRPSADAKLDGQVPEDPGAALRERKNVFECGWLTQRIRYFLCSVCVTACGKKDISRGHCPDPVLPRQSSCCVLHGACCWFWGIVEGMSRRERTRTQITVLTFL